MNNSVLNELWFIVNQVCGYNFPLKKSSRKREEVAVRHIFWTIAHEHTDASLQQLANYNFVDHHTSVLHGIKRVRRASELTPLKLQREPVIATWHMRAEKQFLESQTEGLDIIIIPKNIILAYL